MFGEYENGPDGDMLHGDDGGMLENLAFAGCVALGRMLGFSGPSSPPLGSWLS